MQKHLKKILITLIIFKLPSSFADASQYGIPTTVIKVSSHTAAQNLKNKQICEEDGGEDVTDQTDITIGVGSKYPVICIYKNPPKGYKNNVSPQTSLKGEFVDNPTIPTVSTIYGQNYEIIGYTTYT